jgi:hypothetical protein
MNALELLAHGQRGHFHRAHESHAHDEHAHDHGHSHHHHESPNENDQGALSSALTDHDHDAVYFDAGSVADAARSQVNSCGEYAVAWGSHGVDSSPSLEQHLSARPRYGGQVPTFLKFTHLLL